jgi:hypothetical protein
MVSRIWLLRYFKSTESEMSNGFYRILGGLALPTNTARATASIYVSIPDRVLGFFTFCLDLNQYLILV